ncbi:pSer/pThr/pTyr-binding forkhead associated (FHA) protein [Nocardiopsis mwathae]|uniref:PSer/pThr/pTyr-binding forkhead associated (FHA) protein n=1 Tax=Nocardiopsis mwathae TaxID=1472723 RepID=A0A7W9YH63_9ACTN|nr:FHA domain-containing protein [Nocardiopsis mwathae]MBB6172075.1 pSer/pThr/pTyr-binding forkhead associated (FHA) protein [Nocardiopsis mwathae]
MSSVYCTQCGHAVADDARFCSFCGTPIRAAGQEAPRAGERRDSVGETTSTISISGIQALEAEIDAGDEPPTDPANVDALPPGTALLVVKRGPNAGSRFLLDSDVTTAGRHPNSDIFLDDVTVSRRHVEFFRRGDGFGVRDVGSLNGTYVNRERIDEAELGGGDEVQIGKFRLVLLTKPRR